MQWRHRDVLNTKTFHQCDFYQAKFAIVLSSRCCLIRSEVSDCLASSTVLRQSNDLCRNIHSLHSCAKVPSAKIPYRHRLCLLARNVPLDKRLLNIKFLALDIFATVGHTCFTTHIPRIDVRMIKRQNTHVFRCFTSAH